MSPRHRAVPGQCTSHRAVPEPDPDLTQPTSPEPDTCLTQPLSPLIDQDLPDPNYTYGPYGREPDPDQACRTLAEGREWTVQEHRRAWLIRTENEDLVWRSLPGPAIWRQAACRRTHRNKACVAEGREWTESEHRRALEDRVTETEEERDIRDAELTRMRAEAREAEAERRARIASNAGTDFEDPPDIETVVCAIEEMLPWHGWRRLPDPHEIWGDPVSPLVYERVDERGNPELVFDAEGETMTKSVHEDEWAQRPADNPATIADREEVLRNGRARYQEQRVDALADRLRHFEGGTRGGVTFKAALQWLPDYAAWREGNRKAAGTRRGRRRARETEDRPGTRDAPAKRQKSGGQEVMPFQTLPPLEPDSVNCCATCGLPPLESDKDVDCKQCTWLVCREPAPCAVPRRDHDHLLDETYNCRCGGGDLGVVVCVAQ